MSAHRASWFGVLIFATLCGVMMLSGCGRLRDSIAESRQLTIEEYTVTYNGTRLELGSKLEEWKRALGEPSRYVDRAGGIYVWDDLGLAISLRLPFPSSAPHVAALRVFFNQRDVDFWPRSAFRGLVTFVQSGGLPGSPSVVAKLDARTTLPDLEKRQQVSTRYGYPYLSRYTVVRVAAPGAESDFIELCSVQIDATAVRLPWESDHQSSTSAPPGRR